MFNERKFIKDAENFLRVSVTIRDFALLMQLCDSHGVTRPAQVQRSPGSMGSGEDLMERVGPESAAHVLDGVEPG